jgi:hypothetical protein
MHNLVCEVKKKKTSPPKMPFISHEPTMPNCSNKLSWWQQGQSLKRRTKRKYAGSKINKDCGGKGQRPKQGATRPSIGGVINENEQRKENDCGIARPWEAPLS